MKRILSTVIFSALAFFLSGFTSAGKTHFLRALMDGAQADMGNGTGSPATGVAQVTYDDVTNELGWDISWTANLLGTETAMHFHGPAAAGANAGVTQGIGVGSNPAVGSATITPAAGADLLAGLWYVNLHTSAEGGGEIRGQVLLADLGDDFSGDLSNWTASNRGLENNADAGYDPPDTTGGVLTLGGTTNNAFWYGNSLESVALFDSRLSTSVTVRRVSLTGSGTAWRSSLWIQGDDGHYMHFAQDVGETGWSYNARDDGGTGTLTPTGGGTDLGFDEALDSDPGSFEMGIELVPLGAGTVEVNLLHDGVQVATHQFTNFPTFFRVILTGQARAANDTVSAVFDDLTVFQESSGNLPPGFNSNPINAADAEVNTAYTGTLAGEAIDPDDDEITFSKVSGPGWLQVAADGGLSGTPLAADTGVNEFTVRAADAGGGQDATLVIRVIDPNATPSGDLFGWWPLNDGTGSIAADISGNGNDATITNVDTGGPAGGTAWVEDPECGMVLSFSGDDATGAFAQALEKLPLFTNDPENVFTWAFWAKSDNPPNNDIILGNRWDENGVEFSPREFIKFDGNNFEYDTLNVLGVDYDDIQPGTGWIHHVVVKVGSDFTYYRDGVQAGVGTAGGPQNNQQPLFFAGQAPGERWAGSLFDVRLFTSALSADDVFTVFGNKGEFTGGAEFKITSIVRAANGDVTLTWNSKNNQDYGLDYSTSLKAAGEQGGWTELDDGIASGGDTTTVTVFAANPAFPATEPRLFFRAREVP